MLPATDSGLFIGRRLGEFILREQIGEGGFGAVYRAEQEILEREAVIKISLRGSSERPDEVANFLREAKLASRIDHPFAAHVYAFGAENDGTRWIAMELVRGMSLADMLAQGPMPVQRAIPLLVRLCEVVHTVHEQGIVHRDIKPNNVMVISRAGAMFPKLLDLGVASDLAQAYAGTAANKPVSASSSSMAGTPLYMAPEQWVPGAPVTPATDVYALGALAYEMLTGKPPFSGNTPMELATKHARTPPPRLPDEFTSGLADAIVKALTKRPKERFASALELGTALRDASGLSVEAVDLPSLDPTTRDEIFMGAPQPIAESVAAMEAARTPHQLRAALWRVTTVLSQYVGNLALAMRQRAAGRQGDAPEVTRLLGTLSTGTLDASQWWTLTRELVRPFADASVLYPLPALVEVFFEGGGQIKNAMDTLLASRTSDPGDKASADEVRVYLVGAMSILARALRALRFLHEYRLVVVRGANAEEWMGVRRPLRVQLPPPPGLGDGPALIDRDGMVVVSLTSVATCGEPSPGAPEELFFLIGAVRDAARLMALPGALELRRDDVWTLHQINIGKQAASEQATGEELAPYLGLQTFSAANANLYFGREAEVLGFINRMSGRRFIAVVGPSGSGKSSFIQAGVLPNLSESRTVVVLRPGSSPLDALTHAMKSVGIEITRAALEASRDALTVTVLDRMAAAKAAGTPMPSLFLVVDQFEELVTMCLDETMQAQFADALMMLGASEETQASVVITLRDDFLIRIAQIPALRDRLSSSLHLVTTPVEEDLRRILTEPARRSGYEFEDAALVTEIAKEVAHQSAALALLSFTAYQLWQFRDKHFRRLTRKAYQTLGGVGGALAHHAESVLGAMTEEEQRAVREVFRHLVTADGTRASLSRAELLQVAGGAAAEPVLERLIGARLLVAQEGADAQERIEVIHEALLAAWPRLVKWRHEDADGARLRDQLRVAAKQWNERDRDRGLLWRGDTLTEYRLWRARYPGAITQLEEQFAEASLAHAQRTKRRWQIFAGFVLTALVITTIVFARLRTVAEQSRALAATQLTESYVEQGRRSLLENDASTSLLYLREAVGRGAKDPAMPFMLARAIDPLRSERGTIVGPTGKIWRAVYSADAKRILVVQADGAIAVWRADTLLLERRFAAHPAGRSDAAWVGDNRFVSAGVDGVLHLWDLAAEAPIRSVTFADERTYSLAWNPALRQVVFVSYKPTVRTWNVDTGEARLLRGGDDLSRVYFFAAVAPKSGVVAASATASDGGFVFAELHDGARVVALKDNTEAIVTAVFNPSEDKVAAVLMEGATLLWDVKTGRLIRKLEGHRGYTKAIAWSRDGTTLATGGVDKTVRIWNVASGESLVLNGHAGDVTDVRFSADGKYLYSVSNDGTAKVWETQRGILVTTLLHGGLISGLDIASGANQFITASMLGSVKVWQVEPAQWLRVYDAVENNDLYEPRPVLTTQGHLFRATAHGVAMWNTLTGERLELPDNTAVIAGVAVLDQGATLASLTQAGRLVLYDVAARTVRRAKQLFDGTNVVTMRGNLHSKLLLIATEDKALHWLNTEDDTFASIRLPAEATGLDWSANGKTVVALLGRDEERGLAVFDATTQTKIAEPEGRWVSSLVSPDGERIVGWGISNVNVVVLDKAGKRLQTLSHSASVRSVVFTPAGDKLLVGLEDGNVNVWAFPEGRLLSVLSGHRTDVNEVAVSVDGALAYCMNGDGDIFVWDLIKFRNLSRQRTDIWSIWVLPDPTQRALITVSLSGNIDVRALPSLAATEITLLALDAYVCKIPRSLREQTPTTAVCKDNTP